ncbi:MAG: membrane dipeptidase [bacterium]|nr:membrane dipeptidase [bacterium]
MTVLDAVFAEGAPHDADRAPGGQLHHFVEIRQLRASVKVPLQRRGCALGVFAGLLPALLLCGCSSTGSTARDLHFDSIVIDGHSDTTPRFEDPNWSFGDRHSTADGDMDLPRIREGGLDVQFWSIYMGRRETAGTALREALERIDAVHEMAARYPADVVVAGSVREIRAAVAAGKFVSLMGIEGGHIIEESLPALRNFYRLGVRYMTLTHSFHTSWADSSGTTEVPEPVHGGLTKLGARIVTEMNRIGMLVDISHVSDETFFDVLEVSRAPIIASHSSARAVADHPRNMTDEMLRALARNGGIAMINFYPVYIDERARDEARAYFAEYGSTLEQLVVRAGGDPVLRRELMREHFVAHPVPQTSMDVLLDHFDHAIAVAGPDHVGIGADWDGVASMPVGMEDVSELPGLTAGLLARGHSVLTVRKVLGENLLRVLEDAERIARDMRDAEVRNQGLHRAD